MKISLKKKHILFNWQWPLTIVFLCFGFLLIAQYQTNEELSGTLANESQANLAMILKSVTDNKEQVQTELDSLKNELSELQSLVDSGSSISTAIKTKIDNLQTAIGTLPVKGTGLTITITGDSNLMFYDVIDIINELFVSGAEAVAINDTRITNNTQISEKDSGDKYTITINDDPLLFPVVLKAIGDPVSLETGLTYPGGIIENLNTLYHVYPEIHHEEEITIPAAIINNFKYAAPVNSEIL